MAHSSRGSPRRWREVSVGKDTLSNLSSIPETDMVGVEKPRHVFLDSHTYTQERLVSVKTYFGTHQILAASEREELRRDELVSLIS